MKKSVDLFLFCNIQHDKPQKTTHTGPKGILTITEEVKNELCNTKDVVDNTNFEKKGTFQWNKKF